MKSGTFRGCVIAILLFAALVSGNVYYTSDVARNDLEHGNVYFDNNAIAQIIETADTPIACRHTTGGLFYKWSRVAGSTGGITVFADAGGGEVLVTSAAHGLLTGDYITIRGTTNYNGLFLVTKVDDASFKITDGWVIDDGASDWDSPDYLLAEDSSTGSYTISWNGSVSVGGAAGDEVFFAAYKNGTLIACSRGLRKFANNDVGSVGGHGFFTAVPGDRLFMTVQSDDTDDVTIKYGCISVERL